jgi:hypothetical protein
LLLTWARGNGCSCTYDMRKLPRFHPNEQRICNWLFQNARTFINDAFFSNRDGLHDVLRSNGKCLWSSYMREEDYFEPKENFDEEDILEANFHFQVLTDAAAMESKVSRRVRKLFQDKKKPFHFPKKTNSNIQNAADSTWIYKQQLDKPVTAKEVCLYPSRIFDTVSLSVSSCMRHGW